MDAEEQPWPSTPYSGEFHLTALRTPGTVLRQGGFLPRHIAASCPPRQVQGQHTRYLDIHEDEQLDDELAACWIRQASELPGWVP